MAAQLKQRRLICLTGPESSGKTTLAAQLGEHFAAPVAAEFARSWLHSRGGRYTESSLEHIAKGQLANEQVALAESGASPVAIADTDIQVIEVWWWVRFASPSWHQRYALRAPPRRLYPGWLQRALRHRGPRTYLLVTPDLPWQPDPLRESKGQRQMLYAHYRRLLQRDGLPFALVTGQGAERLQRALQGLQQLGNSS